MTIAATIAAILISVTNPTPKEIKSAMMSWRGSKTHPNRHKFQRYADLFVKNATLWKVNPILVSCVAYTESTYKENPNTYVKRCGGIHPLCGKRPGPCPELPVTSCRMVQINKAEEGMMQVLFYDTSTKVCYKMCTGKRYTKRALLRPPHVAICVGTCEMAKWRAWHKRANRWGKYNPKKLYHKKFFWSNKHLLKYYYIAFYNWGPRNVGNIYPLKVLRCYRKYVRHILAMRKKNAEQKAREAKRANQEKTIGPKSPSPARPPGVQGKASKNSGQKQSLLDWRAICRRV